MRAVRDRVESVLTGPPFLQPWAFEHTPASSQDVDEAYLEKVRRSAFVFWLVGSRTTDPVKREIEEAIAADRRLIVLKLPTGERDATTEALLRRVQPVAKYRELTRPEELETEVNLAVSDEINRALQDQPGMSRVARLDELGRASRARCIERWEVAGVSSALAFELADDVTVGAGPDRVLPDEGNPLRVLSGDMGVGKSLAGERFHQAAIAAQLNDTTMPVPVYLRAPGIGDDLQAKVVSAAHGLGDPRQQGASIVVDGIDEPGLGSAAEILRQATVLARTWPSTRILVTSRPLSVTEHATNLVVLPQLDPAQASQLVGRVAGIAMTPGREAGWPENLRQAIRLPLFAVLLGGYLRRADGAVPTSRGELLRSLVDQAVGRVDADVGPLLRRLAVRSLIRSGGPVPEAEVVGLGDVAHLEETRLVVWRGGTLVFPLIVIAQWFAAESLIRGDPAPENLADRPGDLEIWRYPLAIAVGTYRYEEVSAVLAPLARTHAGFASQVVEEGLAKWSLAEDVLPPSVMECGQQIRAATEAWVVGTDSAKALLWPVVRRGAVAPIGTHVAGHWLTTAWYAGEEDVPDVNQMPTGSTDPARAMVLTSWTGGHSARPGRQAAWAWRWSFEEVRSVLVQHLKGRVISFLDGPLADAELWAWLCSLSGMSFMYDEPMEVGPAGDAIRARGNIMFQVSNGRRIPAERLAAALQLRLDSGEAAIEPPFPGPDLSGQHRFIWEPWSEQRLLERTRAVFTAALLGYEALVTGLFASLAPWMQTAVTLPAVLHGELNPGDPAVGFTGGPTIAWWFEALPSDDTSRVEIKIECEDRRREQYEEFRGTALRSRTLRPREARWLDATLSSSMLEVFGLWSAQELVYHWLWDDLKRIRWVDGLLTQTPNWPRRTADYRLRYGPGELLRFRNDASPSCRCKRLLLRPLRAAGRDCNGDAPV
jgi:hypothetical protein